MTILDVLRHQRVENQLEEESRMRRAVVLGIILVMLSMTGVQANDNFFLPGDAYFPTQLTEESLQEFQAQDTPTIEFIYSSLGGYEATLLGYAGYRRARIPAVDQEFVGRLRRVYSEIRKTDPKQLVETTEKGKIKLLETNGIKVLFCPIEFPFPKYSIGLRYNEKWVEEAMKFGLPRETLRLCELIDLPNAMERSWRDSTQIGSFDVELPEVKFESDKITEAPVTLKGKVKAIVFGSYSVNEIYQPNRLDVRSLYVIDFDSSTRFDLEDGSWTPFHGVQNMSDN